LWYITRMVKGLLLLLALASVHTAGASPITVTCDNQIVTAIAADVTTPNVAPGFAITTFDFTGLTAGDAIATYTTPSFDYAWGTTLGYGDFLSLNSQNKTVITFSQPVAYFGFLLGSPDLYNHVQILSGATVLLNWTPPVAGPTYFVNFNTADDVGITSVKLSTTKCCFETDNHAYVLETIHNPEPAAASLVLLGGLGFTFYRRRRR
jgi:hypothetical protein